jgi:ribosomal protein S18 acetylase RimI-like enzyme
VGRRDVLTPEVRRLDEDGKVGAVALRAGKRVGRLLGALREDDIRGRHAWSSLGDHEVGTGEEPALYRRLYEAAGAAWVAAGYLDHYVVVPADREMLDAWYSLSFAQQQVHASLPLTPRSRPDPRDFTLRLGGPEDIELAMALAYVIYDHQATGPTWAGVPAPDEDETRAAYEEYLAQPTVTYFIAERDGTPLGHVALEDEGDGIVYLSVAATVPEERGSGVGTALTDLALGWAHEQGYRTCVTDWRSANLSSSRFWTRKGFRPTAYRLVRSIRLSGR